MAETTELRRLPDPSEQPVLEVPQVAKILNLSLGSTYAAIRRGEIPSLRLGRRLIVPTEALRKLLAG